VGLNIIKYFDNHQLTLLNKFLMYELKYLIIFLCEQKIDFKKKFYN